MKISGISSHPNVPVKIFEEEGVRYQIVLPDAAEDYIQHKLLETGKPYGLDILQNMRQRIREGDLVLDVGANVGNHALYLASVARARVIAFEPNAHLCSAMHDSIVRNGLEDLVSVQTLGLGRAKSFAHFEKSIPENLGAQALELGDGDIEVVSLDSLQFDTVVRMIKIDVEGMELAVIQGGRECIERDRPILYVECRDDTSFRQVLSWAQTHSYTYWETFNVAPTHLFMPAETVSLEERIDHLNAHNAIREYRVIAKLQEGRESEAEAKTEIKRLEEELVSERSAKRAAESAIETLHKNLAASAAESKLELEKVRAYGRELEDCYLVVLDSKTWKIMEPVRKVLRLVKGRQPPPPFTPRLRADGDLTAVDKKSEQAKLDRSRVDDLTQKLWRGFSGPATGDLAGFASDKDVSRSDRAKAAWHLARWTAASGDWDACLSHLGKVAYLNKTFFRSKRPRILATEANLRVGKFAKAIEYAEHGLNRELDGNYICGISNALLRQGPPSSVDRKRLAMVNQLYDAEGLASLALIDPAKGFVFGNLASEGTVPTRTDGPTVSVLVPVYNAGAFVETSIGSMLAQSWRNLEIIAVDDASTDDSWARLQRLSSRDSRLSIFRNETNLGAYPTRNRALKQATGELVTVHDSDDWSHPQMIEAQAEALLSTSDIKATFSLMTRVLPNMEFMLRPERNFLEYVHRSYPSLMMRRSDLARLEQWDDVAANADDELVQRARDLWGNDALQEVLRRTPLSFFLRHDQSLTEQKGTHLRSLTFGIRQEYANQAAFWRKAVAPEQLDAGGSIARTDIKTPFPIPAGLAPKNWKRDPVYDLIIISDLSLLGGTRRCNEGYIAAATALGLRIGLFHWPRYDLKLTEVAPEYRRLSYQPNLDILVPEDSVECDTVLIHHPPILNYRIDAIPDIAAERVAILVNQLPMQRLSAKPHYYFADEVGNLCRDLFSKEPVWIPISPLARRILGEIGGYSCHDGSDWIPPLGRTLDAEELPLRPDVGSARQIVLGRHSRDHVTKWPNTANKIRSAYCANTNIAVRLMGGVRTPKRVLGNLPTNWQAIAFDETSVAEFLAGLDFFVHFIDDDYIEEFGRGTMEAMAVGIPALLPPVFRETFGDAAVYCEPEEVAHKARELWADPDAYREQAVKGYTYVRTTADQRAVMSRLSSLVQRHTTSVSRDTGRMSKLYGNVPIE